MLTPQRKPPHCQNSPRLIPIHKCHMILTLAPTPPTPRRQLFPNPWMLRWRLSHPPILLSGLWLFGWDLAVSNVVQLKIPQRWKQRESNLQHHPPVRAKIGRNQIAPHRKLPSVCESPSKKNITRFFDSIPNRVKSVFFFLPPHTPNWCVQPAISSQMRWAASP